MIEFLAALQNILPPVVLFFILGAIAALVRSDLEIPAVLGKGLSLYLVVSIGLKGGFGISHATWEPALGYMLALGLALGLAIPLLAWGILRALKHVPGVDRAALAAAYGSVSVVTFVAASTLLTRNGTGFSGFLVAIMVIMEVPAILVGLFLARRQLPGALPKINATLREVFTGGTVLLLLGSLAIGWLSGSQGEEVLAPVLVKPLQGVLAFFLLEMGIVATRRLREGPPLGIPLLAFGVLMPLISGALALLGAWWLGFSAGDATLLVTLAASASYIAVPATFRHAVPEANPGIYLTMALGVTFPFNLVVGIPLYNWAAAKLLGG